MTENEKRRGGKPPRPTKYEKLNATLEKGLKGKISLHAPGWGKMSGFVEEAIRRELERREAAAHDEVERAAVDDIRNEIDNIDVLIVGRGSEEFISQAVNYTYHYLRFFSFRGAIFELFPRHYKRYADSVEQYDAAKQEATAFLGKGCNFDEDHLLRLISSAKDAGAEEARELAAAYEKINSPEQGLIQEETLQPKSHYARLWDIFETPSPFASASSALDDTKYSPEFAGPNASQLQSKRFTWWKLNEDRLVGAQWGVAITITGVVIVWIIEMLFN
ncbi:hypothetical protein CO671_01805 [Rhizobium sp. M10]|uniref:hypothetical protein n=1 Tax=Rhizobium sp. M10 TaxID=1324586 RepID=UPI000BE81A0E|nr:hypothetical protein [Rhizobium sp. M10]PDT38157.1 hypothetical protein CO671_01805 [Rhizobium sp. M10]